jgi:hypothetical protein
MLCSLASSTGTILFLRIKIIIKEKQAQINSFCYNLRSLPWATFAKYFVTIKIYGYSHGSSGRQVQGIEFISQDHH